MIEENHKKKPSQVGRHWDLNPVPPECESRALPRSHLAPCSAVLLGLERTINPQNLMKIIETIFEKMEILNKFRFSPKEFILL